MCIVLNAKDICVTGRKLADKYYRWHSGFVVHLKERTLKDQMLKDPTEVIRKAVLRMLPRNKLRDDRDRKLGYLPVMNILSLIEPLSHTWYFLDKCEKCGPEPEEPWFVHKRRQSNNVLQLLPKMCRRQKKKLKLMHEELQDDLMCKNI
ncbi:uncharacterized protein LOC130818837 isoform X2 [Amaranthus tricolor]|uniref:uncharacterized protein LOC130818837 isoform X2 n=1 Tax=Amaranthus tricolor TaxID=29722 RepID=UPI002582D365|nr:uncharacterized protein LOC130818837 isoform X2 [Amaranthus tricolor]XP_057541055.1 uncharacterized protein LOC130818837 isoform X2 [Amaranthus tricolor]